MRTVFIYVLRDPRNDEIKYVGKTVTPYFRAKAHGSLSQVHRQGLLKVEWTRELAALGLRPKFEIIENCEEGNWKAREEFWIAHYGLENLLNVRPCAIPGNFNACSENAKAKLRKSVLRQFSDPARREKHHNAMKKWVAANLDACAKGGKIASRHPNFIAARDRFWSGLTAEQRAELCKRRTAMQGPRVVTPELIAKQQQAQKAAWSNEATRAARIAGIKAAWADPVKRAARMAKNKLTKGVAA